MTEREKIIKIIAPYVAAYGEDETIADALIAADIGDISTWKYRAEVAERGLLRACKVNTIFAEPDVPNILAESVLYEAYIRQAENELAEGKKDE